MDFKKILFKTNEVDVEKSLPDAVIYIANDGKVLWANDRAVEIFETSKIHFMTSNAADFIENCMSMVTNSVTMQKSLIVKACDKELYYDMTARQIETGYVLAFRDAASDFNQQEADKDTSKINREKNNFLLKLTNDIKSPIQSIVGFSQAMTDGLGGKMSDQQEKYMKIINKNSTDLMYFMDKLLELSQTESSAVNVDIKPFDLTSLVSTVVRYNESLNKGKDVRFSLKVEEGFKKTISSDQEILKNVLQNLMEVILKSVDSGDVSINISNTTAEFIESKNLREGNYIMISLTTTSMLLSENDLECMFDPYRIVDSTNRKNVIRAIVLASVKNLVQSLGGIIWVESQILKNTSFNIILPEL